MMKTTNNSHIKQSVTFISGLLVILGMLTGCEPQNGASPAESSGPPKAANWSAELLITGGFAGVHRRLSVNGQGAAQFTDRKTNTKISATLTDKQLYDLAELVKNTPVGKGATNGKTPGCRDCFQYDLTFQYQQRSGRRSLSDLMLSQSNADTLIKYLRQLASDMSKRKTAN